MAKKHATKRDLELLSAGAHTAESFGRAMVSATLAAAAKKARSGVSGRTIKMKLDVSITRITGIGVFVCVWVPGFGRICTIERDERP